ncbi:MAG: phosphoribosylamine--glycine ligase [Patescibacteria group bacterium]|jgi:fusion protein PurCD
MKKVLLLGSAAREQAIGTALKSSQEEVELYVFGSSVNPGLQALAKVYKVGQLKSNTAIASFALASNVDFAIIGPENPLAEGIVDVLEQIGIPSVGPTKALAQVETSKSFTRDLFVEYKIPGAPKYQVFTSTVGLADWLKVLGDNFVIKQDGLAGGKGVLVSGDHFKGMAEGLKIATELLKANAKIVIEEKLIGQEFSLMSFCDGDHLLHLPIAQDHKRAQAGDIGLNTGGMGSYSCANFTLPFLDEDDVIAAQKINEAAALALKKKIGKGYKGILYGGFMAVKEGVRLIEYNARLADPESMNILSLFPDKTFPPSSSADFLQVCLGIINGTLDKIKLELKPLATVCKYAVPEGYPEHPIKDQKIDVSGVDQNKVKIFYAAVDQKEDGLYLTGSRAVAIVGRGEDLYQTEKMVETEIKKIIGPVFHRADIATKELIDKRIKMMKELRA